MATEPEAKTLQVQRFLLLCGILSPLMYAAADMIAGLSWAEYSFRDYTISELGAIGAPSRLLFSSMLIAVYLLFLPFGIGVWRSSAERRSLKITGALLVAIGLLALMVGQFVPMQQRGMDQGLSGTLHLVEGAVAMFLVLSAMVSAAIAFGVRFRVYTAATIVIMLVFGLWSGLDAPNIEAGLDTPWLGVKERIFWYSYQLWFAVLALTLLLERRELA
ncbi:DUF998 domain-containing protein [Sulfurovum sp.]|uniref:DUF998 domain-containing protein n=1 Tax=Sulfurovum sp. TaxID=1969726 RepID=UPI003567142E